MTNGCTMSPDFNFKDCCDKHDICYCVGGDDNDRFNCDIELYKCIKKKGHPVLASIYYSAVRALGSSHFNYRQRDILITAEWLEDVVTWWPVEQDDEDPPRRKDCKITLSVVSVYYGGKNIGNDWTYMVLTNGQSKKLLANGTHNHKKTKSYNSKNPIYQVTKPQGCNATHTLIISTTATEHDGIVDDHGSSNQHHIQVECKESVPYTSKTFNVYCNIQEEGDWFNDDVAKLKFTFLVETECV